jgi:peptide/nickel transport system permease protein
MRSRVVQQLLHIIVVLLMVTFLIQVLLELIPGSPANVILGDTATPEAVAQVEERLGLDDPFLVRYAHWLGDIADGSFGTSYRTSGPVSDSIVERAQVSATLAVGAMLVAVAVAIPLAVLAASRRNGWLDRAITAGTSAVISIPSFMLAILLMYVFAIQLGWFEVAARWVSPFGDPLGSLSVIALPVLSLALPELVIFTRVLRSDLIGTLEQDFVLAARARGLSQPYVLFRHALRPSSISLMTVAGLSLGRLFGGAVVIETIFSLPGLGRLLITSIESKDLPMVTGVVTFIAVVYVVVNTLIDISYRLVDPRVGAG